MQYDRMYKLSFCYVLYKADIFVQVRWRPVIWGFSLQFLFALLIIKTPIGYVVFDWLGNIVELCITFTDEGSKYLFGDPQYLDHFIAMQVSSFIF